MDGLASPIAAAASLLTTSPLTGCIPTSLGYLTLPQHPQQLISGLAVGGREAADDPMEGATSSKGLDAVAPVPTPKQQIRPLRAAASIDGGDAPLQLEGAIPHMKCATSAGTGSAVSDAVRGAEPPEIDYLAACELTQSKQEAADGRYNQVMAAPQVASVQTPPKNGTGATPTVVQEGGKDGHPHPSMDSRKQGLPQDQAFFKRAYGSRAAGFDGKQLFPGGYEIKPGDNSVCQGGAKVLPPVTDDGDNTQVTTPSAVYPLPAPSNETPPLALFVPDRSAEERKQRRERHPAARAPVHHTASSTTPLAEGSEDTCTTISPTLQYSNPSINPPPLIACPAAVTAIVAGLRNSGNVAQLPALKCWGGKSVRARVMRSPFESASGRPVRVQEQDYARFASAGDSDMARVGQRHKLLGARSTGAGAGKPGRRRAPHVWAAASRQLAQLSTVHGKVRRRCDDEV